LGANYARALYGTNSQGAVLQGNGSEIRKNIYGTDGLLYGQKVFDTTGTQTQYFVWNTGRDSAGNLTQYHRGSAAGSPEYEHTTAYEVGESYREKSVTGVHIGGGGSGTTTSTYDANGFLVGVTDSGQSANNRTFVNDAAGRVLYARQGDHVQRQLVVNGEVMGRYGEVIDDKVARTAEGAPSFTTMADFQFGSQATGGNTPARPDTTHTVGAGDSLKSLAKAYYGDERLWYRIAEANGLFTSDELTAGQVLKIPGTESSLNGAGTFKPYDPSRVVGDTTPFVPLPKPKKLSFFGQLAAIIVFIVVAYYAPEYLPAMIEEIGGSVAVQASAAAAASTASQATSMALGGQDHFSWKQVALSAISAGVTQGLPADLGGAPGSIGNTVARAATGNVITQGIGVATGLQDHFSWQSVAASAVGAGVGQAVGGAMGLSDPNIVRGMSPSELFGARLVTGLAAGTATAVSRGGRVAVQQIAVDAFGSVIGSSLSETSSEMNKPTSAHDYRNGSDIASDSYNPVSSYGYRNSADLQADNYNPAVELGYRNQIDRSSDSYNRASEYGYRNEMDVASDGFDPASLYRYRNGMDVASDQASAAKQWRERMARVTESEQTRERNRFASMAQESGGASFDMRAARKAQDARDLAAYQSRLSSLPVQYASTYDPAPARAAAARNGALLNYLSGQGSMALGGVVSAGVMLGTNDVVSASITTDAVEPFDSLVAPTGGSAASRLGRVRGSRAVDLAKKYEADIRDIYGDVPFAQRTYTALVNGQRVKGVADNVAVINGTSTAIEAKYVDEWTTSLRNPASQDGNRPWAVAEQQKMIDQAVKYSRAFEQTLYHTNSLELANHYAPLFEQAGATNFKFVITPPNSFKP
jgi:LysM repeat protein